VNFTVFKQERVEPIRWEFWSPKFQTQRNYFSSRKM